MGEGKGWAKGRTAATDPRVARNAAAHRGLSYRRHLSPENDRRYRGKVTDKPLTWTPEMAYLLGLVATDGCLVGDRRHVNFTSGDRELIDIFLSIAGRSHLKIQEKRSWGFAYAVQPSHVRLWAWLASAGLTPRKSLTLGGLTVPDELLHHCARGLMDGDGTISNFVHAPTRRTYPNYRYERLIVKFHSASRPHLEWLASALARVLRVNGAIVTNVGARRHRGPMYVLAYGKRATIVLLSRFYDDPRCPRLTRKYEIWRDFADRQMTMN